ncbi:aldo/keto reductase [Petrimonas sulfuriphila]|jgi:hypothetical protein|uniref:aldo/keto reductase n=1 Tax=Petrimonas sulfuriphila TaxID=285070 RepID=UPI002A2D245F|nr:aldo/keto reductase [Petrimonas sp.]MDD4015840.1 aldo/keto reductase [Petrimonas sp.]
MYAMKENDGKQKISRRTALKYMGLGAAVIPASLYLGGCTKKTDKSQPVPDLTNIPTDKMTYTALSKTGDKISLLGFGTMRYPTVERETPEGIRKFIDEEKAGQLVDYAIAHGINYFDTAWMYHQGESEIVTGKLLKKYPRNSFYLATKLPGSVKSREDAIATYHKQLEKLQVDYFDYYHLHSLSSDVMYERIYKEWGMLDFLLNEKKEGRIRNLGWSFHGDQPLFDKVLAEPVDWDFVMIQMNYFDWKYGRVPAEYMYNRLVERNIPVMIMEPLLGSRLAKVSRAVSEMMQEERPGDTPAQWAFRFVGSHPQVMVVLSGMTLMEHLQENIKTYSPLVPVTDKQKDMLAKAAEIIRTYKIIPCTDCKYCVPCPYGVDIPGILLYYNKATWDSNLPDLEGQRDAEFERASRAFLVDYNRTIPELEQANHCINCGECEPTCPQNIKIPTDLLKIDNLVQQLKTT